MKPSISEKGYVCNPSTCNCEIKKRINLDGFSYMKHAVNSLGTTYKN